MDDASKILFVVNLTLAFFNGGLGLYNLREKTMWCVLNFVVCGFSLSIALIILFG